MHSRILHPGPHVTPMPFSSEIRRIQSALDALAHRCILCWVLQKDALRPDHLLRHCSHSPNIYTSHHPQWSSWRAQVHFPEGYCFGCGLPQHVRVLHFVSFSHLSLFRAATIHSWRLYPTPPPRQRSSPNPVSISRHLTPHGLACRIRQVAVQLHYPLKVTQWLTFYTRFPFFGTLDYPFNRFLSFKPTPPLSLLSR